MNKSIFKLLSSNFVNPIIIADSRGDAWTVCHYGRILLSGDRIRNNNLLIKYPLMKGYSSPTLLIQDIRIGFIGSKNSAKNQDRLDKAIEKYRRWLRE